MCAMVQTVLDWLFRIIQWQRHVQVLTHRASLLPNGPECYFINVTNLSPQRSIEVTHVWMACSTQIHVLNVMRPLPHRLEPDASWETWIQVSVLPESCRDNAFKLARVRLSDSKVLRSQKNLNVPAAGFVPGS